MKPQAHPGHQAGLHTGDLIEEIGQTLDVSAEQLAQGRATLELMGHPLRRTLFEKLSAGDQPIDDQFLRIAGATRATIQHHLRRLRSANLIVIRHYACAAPDSLINVRKYLDVLLCAASRSQAAEGAIDLDMALEALSDAPRLQIFEHIAVRPRRVGELGAMMPVSRPAVSHHARVLRRAGLVTGEGAPLSVVLSSLREVRTYFDRLWLEASLGERRLTDRRTLIADYGL